MSLLFTEYDEEVAKRMYAEELVEDIAEKMIRDGEPIEKITKYFKSVLEKYL